MYKFGDYISTHIGNNDVAEMDSPLTPPKSSLFCEDWKSKFLQTQPLSVDLLRASDFRQLGTVDVSEQAAKLFVSVIPPMPMNVITSPPIPPSQST